ncbi:MAG: phosphatidate cytidylyltransferase [Salibacteraceae bacterium]
MGTRAISGLVFVSLVIGSLILGFYTSLILFSVIAFIGTLEFYKLAKKSTNSPFTYLGAFLSSIMVILSGYFITSPNSYWVFSIWMLFGVAFVIRLLSKPSDSSLTDISVTISGGFYLAIPLVSLLILGIFPSFSPVNFNWQIPLSIFILTWTNDTGAYLSGRTFGKTKLFERISPNKTWEGSIGGGIFTVIGAIIICYVWGIFSLPIWIGAAVLVSIFANLGDLMESAFKRNAGVKDSGKIMPGHGGVLDRFDAILLTAPVVLAYLLSFSDI